jgi:citronellol/citronellal dehydrogenase
MKLMMGINVIGPLLLTKSCMPYLEKSENPHVLFLVPPLPF